MDGDLGRAIEIEKEVERFEVDHPDPRWSARSEARIAALFDCLWSSLRRADPTLTPEQQATARRLAGLLNGFGPPPANAAQAVAQSVTTMREAWLRGLHTYLDLFAAQAVRHYVTAHLLARRHALGGEDVARAGARLSAIASVLGPDTMSPLLADFPDPTDPAPDLKDRACLRYAPRMFDAGP